VLKHGKSLSKAWFVIALLVVPLLIMSACAGAAPGGFTIQPVSTADVAEAVALPDVATDTPAEAGAETHENMAEEQKLFFVKEGSLGRGHIPGLDSEIEIGSWVFVPPFFADTENNLLPGLATHYDVNEDSTVFTLHINPDAVWSDGKPITAQDFIDWWTFIFAPAHQDWPANQILGPVVGFQEFSAGEADTIEGIKAIDDKTLEISLVRPEGWFPLRMAMVYAAPARVENYASVIEAEEAGTVDPANKFQPFRDTWANAADLIVSGPYKPVELVPEPEAIYRYELNANWWGEAPIITSLEGTTIRDFQTMLLMFENSEADLLLQLAGGPAVLLMDEQPDVFREMPRFAYWAMWFDTTQTPADDVNLRKALLSAIEWERLPEVAWEGLALTSNAGSLLPPTMPCFDAAYQPYPFDVEAAQASLAESQYGPTGADVPKIRILTDGSDPQRIRAAQIIQEMWRVNLGIEDVEIKNVESEFVDGTGLVTIRVSSGGTAVPVPGVLLENAAHSLSGANTNFHHAATPELDAKIEELLGEDPTADDYCGKVQTLLHEIDDMALVIPTAYVQTFYQVQPWVHGAERSFSGLYTLPEMWISER
jgi:ABC-type transport system substrate-binding protein